MINQHKSVDNTLSPHKTRESQLDLPSLTKNRKRFVGLNRSAIKDKSVTQHHKSSYISSIQSLTANVQY